MRVLITGGAGFIGSHLGDSILAAGGEVLVIDNFATGRRDNLNASSRLTLVEGTIADPELVEDSFKKFRPTVVVHAAAAYKDPDDWAEDARTNALGAALVAHAARAHEVTRLIYFQSATCYGLQPIEQPITLDHPIRSEASSYAITKTAGEQFMFLSGVDTISFRMANAYGPRHQTGPLPLFYQRLSAGKPCFVMNTRRDFVFIDDLLELLMQAVAGQGKPGSYHMSSGSDVSMAELLDVIAQAMGIGPVQAEVRERSADDVHSILLDPSETQRVFGWSAHTPLSQGIPATIAHYREHGIEAYTHLKLDPPKPSS